MSFRKVRKSSEQRRVSFYLEFSLFVSLMSGWVSRPTLLIQYICKKKKNSLIETHLFTYSLIFLFTFIPIVTKCKNKFKNASNPVIMPLCYAMLGGALWQLFQLSCFHEYVCIKESKGNNLCQLIV